ncbi:uncharacterized protein LOC119098228 [Pollicipes pollicipes]|uniref:uncharacterized protein LOC119098228 n=1 Tax=Pollicipes pollicipes TaxID=41117 RepID=UPI001885417E|nr:uncharacterized protein LOC119098228 [Pollicipes pollicipes]
MQVGQHGDGRRLGHGLTMWRWARLLLVLLTWPSLLAAEHSCAPRLQVEREPAAGGRLATVRNAVGCHCRSLRLTLLQRRGRPCAALNRTGCAWHVLPTHGPRQLNLTLVLAGWYRPSAFDCSCDGDDACAGPRLRKGTRRWVPGLRLDAWNVSLSAVPQPDGHLVVSVSRQFGAAGGAQLYFPRLELDQLKAYLCVHGIRVHDFQEGAVLNAFQRQASVPAALAVPPLRGMQLMFVTAERGARPLRPAAAQVRDSVLRHVNII